MTESNYNLLLVQLKESQPEHPLLAVLQKGSTPLNDRRLIAAIQERPIETEDPLPDELPETMPEDVSDNIMRGLYITKSNLFVTRAKLSNQLQECETDAQRAKIVDQILIVQGQIEAHFHRMKQYAKTGVLPENDEEYPIPKDTVKLLLQLNSCRASISQYSAKITDLFHIEVKSEQQLKILEKHESRLKHYEIYKKILEDEVRRRKTDADLFE